MLKYPTRFFFISGMLFACSWAYKITPFVKEGLPSYSGVKTAPYVKIGDGFYYFANSTRKNWFDAFASCRKMNANLVSFETVKEFNSIMNYRRSVKDTNRYWTSGTDLGAEGSHVWLATGKPININVWTLTNPDNYKGIEHCDELGWHPPNRPMDGMNDCQCTAKLYYICEASKPQTASFIIW